METIPNPVRGGGPLDTMLAKLRHGIPYRKLKTVAPLNRCLDIGSGSFPVFLSRLSAREKYGLEQFVSEQSARNAALRQIQLIQRDLADASPLEFGDGFFDAVTMLAVIEHIPPLRVPFLLTEIHRILRPNGLLILTTPAAWTDRLLRAMAASRLISKQEIDDHKDTFTQPKLHAALTQAGFQNIQTGTFECCMNLWACGKK